jgi:hypothetical protein
MGINSIFYWWLWQSCGGGLFKNGPRFLGNISTFFRRNTEMIEFAIIYMIIMRHHQSRLKCDPSSIPTHSSRSESGSMMM